MLTFHTIALCQNCQCVIVGENNDFKYSLTDSCCNNNYSNAKINENLTLVVDSVTGAYLIAEVISSNKDCFLVNLMPSDEKSSLISKDSVWVSKANISIGLRGPNHNGMSKIPLYNRPDYSTMHGFYVINTASTLAHVLECKNGWCKIRLNCSGVIVVGWLAPENQCTNMYTMCMGE